MADQEAEEPPHSGNNIGRQSAVTSALWTTVSSVLSIPILAASTILVARFLRTAAFGKMAIYAVLLTIIPGVIDFGITGTIIRRGAVAATSLIEQDLIAAVRSGSTWCLLQFPVMALIAILVLPAWISRTVYIVSLALMLGFKGPSHYLIMTNNLRYPSILRLVTGILGSGLAVAAAALTHRADMTYAIPVLVSAIPTFTQVFAMPRGLRRYAFRPGRLSLSREDVAFGLSNVVQGQLTSFIYSESEVLFFPVRAGIARGRFAAAQTIGARSSIVLDALLGNLGIGLSNALGKGEESLRRAFRSVSDWTTILFMLVTPGILIGVAVLSDPVFGRGYGNLAAPALALSATSLLQTASGPLMSLRYAQKSMTPVAVAGLAGAVGDVVLAATLVPVVKVVGAVLASTVATTIFTYLMTLWYRKQTEFGAIATRHMLKMTAIILYSGAVASSMLVIPVPGRYISAPAIALIATIVPFRTKRLQLVQEESVVELQEALPVVVGRLFQRRTFKWLLGRA